MLLQTLLVQKLSLTLLLAITVGYAPLVQAADIDEKAASRSNLQVRYRTIAGAAFSIISNDLTNLGQFSDGQLTLTALVVKDFAIWQT